MTRTKAVYIGGTRAVLVWCLARYVHAVSLACIQGAYGGATPETPAPRLSGRHRHRGRRHRMARPGD